MPKQKAQSETSTLPSAASARRERLASARIATAWQEKAIREAVLLNVLLWKPVHNEE